MHGCRADGGADIGGADGSADGRIRRFCSGLKTTVLKSSSKLSSCRLVKPWAMAVGQTIGLLKGTSDGRGLSN